MNRRKRMLNDLDEDIRAHIEAETQDNILCGMSPEARYAALRKFGNVTRVKEETREVWSFIWLEQLLQDIRLGFRVLRTAGRAGVTFISCDTIAPHVVFGLNATNPPTFAGTSNVVNTCGLRSVIHPSAFGCGWIQSRRCGTGRSRGVCADEAWRIADDRIVPAGS